MSKWMNVFLCTLLFITVRTSQIEDEHSFNAVPANRWPTDRTLTWKLDYNSIILNWNHLSRDVQQAFDDWSRYSPLSFREATNHETADFHLAFVSADQRRGVYFDGPGGKISHSFPLVHHHAGYIYFDASERWTHTYDDNDTGFNVRVVAAHEIGFSLGVAYSNDPGSIMSSDYHLFQPHEMLPTQDQESIQALYGRRENSEMSVNDEEVWDREKRSLKKGKTNKKKKKVELEEEEEEDEEDESVEVSKKTTKSAKNGEVTRNKKRKKIGVDEDSKTKRRNKKKKKKRSKKQGRADKYSKTKSRNTKKRSQKKPKIEKRRKKLPEKKTRSVKKKKKLLHPGYKNTSGIGRYSAMCPEKDRKLKKQKQSITFTKCQQDHIIMALKNLKHNGTLLALQKFPEIINSATGSLSVKYIPNLQQLAASYTSTTNSMKSGFANVCALLSSLVIKIWRSMQRGMTNTDKNTLLKLANQLNTDFKSDLSNFINVSRNDLIRIYSQLFLEEGGPSFETLLNRKDELEQKLLGRSKILTDAASKLDETTVKLEVLKYKKMLRDKAAKNLKAAEEDLKVELERLKMQIPEYEKKIEENRDIRIVKRTRYWIFGWKVREVYVDRGERIARENLARLHERVRTLEETLRTWPRSQRKRPIETSSQFNNSTAEKENSTSEVHKPRNTTVQLQNRLEANRTIYNIPYYQEQLTRLTKEYTELEKLNNEDKKNFDETIAEIAAIQADGVTNSKSIATVDHLCQVLNDGSIAVISACHHIEARLEMISLSSQSLFAVILDALNLINLADEYNGSNKVEDLKRIILQN